MRTRIGRGKAAGRAILDIRSVIRGLVDPIIMYIGARGVLAQRRSIECEVHWRDEQPGWSDMGGAAVEHVIFSLDRKLRLRPFFLDANEAHTLCRSSTILE